VASNTLPIEQEQGRVRHSADDAVDQRDFQLLLETTYELKDPYDIEARLLLFCCGRLGMRVGELIHMDASWIDWRKHMITVPRFDKCTDGRDGGICGYCKQLAEQEAKHNEQTEIRQAMANRWQSKTEAANRNIPFEHHARVQITIDRFFDRFDGYHLSKSAVNRRLQRVKDNCSEFDDKIYPHCLRATAATYLASRRIKAINLQAMMGWSDLSTAQRYVRQSGERTKRALRNISIH